jgi:hypothetical protein
MLGLLRAVALIAVMAGAVGSEVLMLHAGQRSPRLLIVLFTIWVLSPFVALGWANVVSKRWSPLTRATLYGVTLVVTVCSLAVYGKLVVVAPPGSPNAFVWVIVPPASWLVMLAVPVVAFVSGRRSRRSGTPEG